jgi:hypothetical protein
MKHSKIYLGITTCLLAIVGVAATKAHKFSAQASGYYSIGTSKQHCTRASVRSYFTDGTTQATTLTSAKPVFTAPNCAHKLYSNNQGD